MDPRVRTCCPVAEAAAEAVLAIGRSQRLATVDEFLAPPPAVPALPPRLLGLAKPQQWHVERCYCIKQMPRVAAVQLCGFLSMAEENKV
jgi:hypothetical protein